MTREDIEPVVPEMPRPLRADGGSRSVRRRSRAKKTFTDPEYDAPLVPDLR
jgi:hypothetical protein